MEHFAQRHQASRELVPITSQPVAQTNTRTHIHSNNIRNPVRKPSNPVQNYIVCSNCNYRNPTNAKFCSKCGKKLSKRP